MEIMDCTLRDGANVLGNGFPKELSIMILEGLIKNKVSIIEYGNAKGIGAYEISNSIAPLNDEEYLKLAEPYVGKAKIGMFLNAKRFQKRSVELAAEHGLHFLRVGADAGDAQISLAAIKAIKQSGMKAYYALMKGYLLPPEKLAEQALLLQEEGVDEITIMDSAGTMHPADVAQYIQALKDSVQIPVGFHGHNNLGLSAANGLAAMESGADIVDCCLLGMARSAGNMPTEVAMALMNNRGDTSYNLFSLLKFLDQELIPAMKEKGYIAPLCPLDLVLGYCGCHSNFVPALKKAAQETGVELYQLIAEVSKQDRKNPSGELIYATAQAIKTK